MLQPDNGLYIKTWTSDVNDTQFIDLLNNVNDQSVSEGKDEQWYITSESETGCNEAHSEPIVYHPKFCYLLQH